MFYLRLKSAFYSKINSSNPVNIQYNNWHINPRDLITCLTTTCEIRYAFFTKTTWAWAWHTWPVALCWAIPASQTMFSNVIHSISNAFSFNPHTLKYFLYEPWCLFQFEVSINVSVSSYRFIWIPMLWDYGHYKYFTFSVRGSSLDVGIWRL